MESRNLILKFRPVDAILDFLKFFFLLVVNLNFGILEGPFYLLKGNQSLRHEALFKVLIFHLNFEKLLICDVFRIDFVNVLRDLNLLFNFLEL
jgi:hypothetical protein